MIRKKPWNRVNLPVHSISSKSVENNNMHIITNAWQISMQRKRFICGIYHSTQTLLNVQSSGEFVLQCLVDNQYWLVVLLGKKSGKSIDKISRLQKRNDLVKWDNFYVLKKFLAVMQLKVISRFEGVDPKGFLCDLVTYKNLNQGIVLKLDALSDKKLIRI